MVRLILQLCICAALAATGLGGAVCAFMSPTPDNLKNYHSDSDCLQMRVKGRRSGYVWGTDAYEAASRIATAAVHAGLLKDGETKLVKLQMMPAADKYIGSTRNGVRSRSTNLEYTTPGYSFLDDQSSDPPTDMVDAWFRFRGQVRPFLLTGRTQGSVLGGSGGVYAMGSDPGTAAVHAGVLRAGEVREVQVWLLDPMKEFGPLRQSGIDGVRFRAEGTTGAFAFQEASSIVVKETPTDLSTYSGLNGTSAWFNQPSNSGGGMICGTGLYSVHSDFYAAAVHAGRLQWNPRSPEQEVTFVSVTEPFKGSNRNGVTSFSCGGSQGFMFN